VAADLVKANTEPGETTDAFLGRAVVEGICITIVVSLLALMLIGRPLLLLALAAGIGWALGVRPQLLHSTAMQRVAEINRRLPYAIDLGVLLLQAGGTLREALHLLAQGNDPFAEELRLALSAIQSGTPQGTALENMAERIQLEDLSTLVLAINRGEETGAPMAAALTTQAEVYRFRRMQRAEKLAVEAPVKMMFPNMIIMIAVLLVVLGPLLVQLAQGGFL
jgi:tight adherence protein C